MSLDYYIADVFTEQAYEGAQIAVFPKADELSDQQMALIAREMNLSETVFVLSPSNTSATLKMRIFSPFCEIDFAAHPLIATAYVLAENGDISVSDPISKFIFEQNVGSIEVLISSQNGKVDLIQCERSVAPIIDRFTPTNVEIADLLSIEASDIDSKRYTTRLASCGFPYLIVPAWKYETVRNAQFNFIAWSQSAAPQTAAQEILLFSPKTPYQGADFNVRLLGPNIGVRTDPPIGSAMSAFAAYLCSFDFTQEGTHAFSVERGDDDNRRSVLQVEMDNNRQDELDIRIGGRAILIASATLHHLPPK